jgi:RimJ/RimL family protein N-acetyltransferase
LIETDRLLLRPLTPEDIDDLVALHEDPTVARFMGAYDRAGLSAWLRSNRDEWTVRGYGRMAIVERSSGRFVGRSGLKRWPQFDETELGWGLRSDERGHGFATEAAAAALRWGFEHLGVPYITAMIHPDNAASIAVAERLDMSPIRSDTLLDTPVVVYAIDQPVPGTKA